jgi:Ca2+/Na+ antiporter
MAISNVFGSNIFDILLALGLPIVVFSGGKGLELDLTENLISVILLFCILIFYVFALACGRH